MRSGLFKISSISLESSLYLKLDEETGSSKSDTIGVLAPLGCLTKVMSVHDSMMAVEEVKSAIVTL